MFIVRVLGSLNRVLGSLKPIQIQVLQQIQSLAQRLEILMTFLNATVMPDAAVDVILPTLSNGQII